MNTLFFATRVTHAGDLPEMPSAEPMNIADSSGASLQHSEPPGGGRGSDLIRQYQIREARRLLRQSSNKRARAYWGRVVARLERE